MPPTTQDEIIFVSSFPPRECGIATYTQDLMKAFREKFGTSYTLSACALENKTVSRNYAPEVKYILNTSAPADYTLTAEKINRDKNILAVFLQHEFGLFAGEYGEQVLHFLFTLHKPVVVTFHTVLPSPDEKRKQIVLAIAAACESVTVMTENSKKILYEEYGISENKISVIHHGTHLISAPEKQIIKERYGLKGNYVLSTFGLLSSGKCIETALNALPAIINKFPDIIYLIIGKTHPEVVRQDGEKYRNFLEDKIDQLGIRKNVVFVNRYLSLEKLLEYLQLTDIYLFTSKDPNQAVSGTFSYAMGCSCPVISTPIPHAKEMLSGDSGIIVDFQNPDQLAEAAIKLLDDPGLRKKMSLNALHKIRPTSWQNSAIAHAELFRNITGKPAFLRYSLPGISLNHLRRMTTGTGIIQFSDICSPDLDSGYTLDDNARALIAVTKHYEQTRLPGDVALLDVYLNFIRFVQQPDGKFVNYVDRYGKYDEKNKNENLEDSMGRAIWAVGELFSHCYLLNKYFSSEAEQIILKSLDQILKLESPRAIAFSIKGLHRYNRVKKNPEIRVLIRKLGETLASKYHQVADGEWKWFEDYLTYANSTLPEAMLYAWLETGDVLFKNIAKNSFDFLLSLTFTKTNIRVISNKGWHQKGSTRNHFGEQPIDVAYTILALGIFYEVFGENNYKDKMELAFSWFNGNNHLHQIIYNPATGGCCDGLEEHNVNLNQGAESTSCFLLARLCMEKYFKNQGTTDDETELVPIPVTTGFLKG